MRSLLRPVPAQLPVAVAIALALVLIAVWRDHGVLGVLAALATAGVFAAWELIGVLRGPRPPAAYGLPGYRNPRSLPAGRRSRAIAGLIVLIMVVLSWLAPAWSAFAGALLAVAAFAILAAVAYNERRGSARQRARLQEAIGAYGPRFVIYTGRRNDASYQLRMWIPTLERLGVRYVVALRHQQALAPTRPVTGAPILVLPNNSDLDVLIVPGLSVAFYVNGVAENSSLVNYRSLVHVYLGHGDSDKELSVHPMHGMFDRVFVAGQAAIDRYAGAGVIIPAEKFVIVGRPQLATLEQAARPIAELQPQRVLYAPTWRGYNARTTLSSLPTGAALVRMLLARGVVVGFRPHPFSWLGAAERADIAAIDEVLHKDRESSGRPHRLAAEHRDASVAEDFDASDALITDIGSVLVDYFATGKPYLVVLPPGRSAATAQADLPSTAAAYLIEYGDHDPSGVLDELLGTDPLADQRAAVARYYLGDHPGDDAPFLAAARRLIEEPQLIHKP